MGLVAPRHVGSSRTRARSRVCPTGRQILNHCATREVRGSVVSRKVNSGEHAFFFKHRYIEVCWGFVLP